MAGISKENTERAHRSGRFDMGTGEGHSESGSSTEKGYQEERRRAAAWLWRQVRAAERVGLRNRGLTAKGTVREGLIMRELI